MKRILVATDGSPAAHEAMEVGVELAAEQGALVTFLHVVDPLELNTSRFGPLVVRPLELPEPENDPVLADAAAYAAEHGVESELRLIGGFATDEILRIGNELDATLIVVGSRGHGGFKRALLGSVSHAVLDLSSRPVLIVRAARIPAATA